MYDDDFDDEALDEPEDGRFDEADTGLEDFDNGKDDGDKTRMELFDWLQCIVTAVIIGIFIFVFIGRVIGVEQTSMVPTLQNNDRVIMTNLFYSPKNGDIVIFRTDSSAYDDTPLVKRVIAVAGQTIDIDFDEGVVYIDDVAQNEPYVNTPTNRQMDFSGPVTIPEGYIFVMGDNRNASLDSRDSSVGLVDTRTVLGKVLLVVIPGRDQYGNRIWSRIGSVYS